MKKIDISELRAGMRVCGVEKKGRGGALFFVNNILLENESEIRRFSNGYAAIYINADDGPEDGGFAVDDAGVKGRPAGTGGREASGGDVPAGQAEAPFAAELARAKDIKSEAEGLVKSFMNSIRLGREADYGAVHGMVGKMVDSIFRNRDALLSLVRLKSFDNYTFTHSVNVCVLSLAIGRHMSLGEGELRSLGIGAILHDIGKTLIPEGLLNKRGSFSEPEYNEMIKHASLGFEIVSRTGLIGEDARLAVLQHHERYDGSGYQGGLSGADIHPFARVVSVADVYDAMTSRRVYQEAIAPEAALKKMFALRGRSFEAETVERLVRCVGLYPIGTVVELNTGETAVVKAQNPDHSLRPVVLIAVGKDKKMLDDPVEADLLGESGRWVIASRTACDFDVERLIGCG